MAGVTVTEDIIDNLVDIDRAVALMNELGLNSDEVEELSDAQHELRRYLARQAEANTAAATASPAADGIRNDVYKITASNSTKLIQHLMEANKQTRRRLQHYVERCQAMVRRLPETRLVDLKSYYPNADADLTHVQEELYQNECVILVAGETGAGKSTLLNLLLGELAKEFLPVAHMSSTSAICELRYCPYGKLVIYHRDPSMEPVTLDLEGSSAAQTIANYVHQKGFRGEAAFEYSRVEVHWPCEWLKGGITIVDSPGVGESPELTELVKEYLPKAFGFIYVINTPNAGGIDPDRLQDLIFSHIAEQKKGMVGQFNPRSAVFVCNKWDAVPPLDKKRVQEYVMTQLNKTWPGFTDEQVFFMSAEQAIKQLRDQMVANDYSGLLHGIERLIPVGLNNRLAKQYSVSWNIVDRVRMILKAFIFEGQSESDDRKKRVKEAKERLEKLKAQPEQLKRTLKEKVDGLIKKATKQLNAYLEDEETRTRLCRWTKRDCQALTTSTSVETLEERMNAKIMKRIKTEINDWDTEKQVFQQIHDQMIAHFKRQFQSMEVELKNIEDNFTSEETNMQTIINDMGSGDPDFDVEFTLNEKLAIGLSAPIWVPVGLVIGLFALPVAGIMALHKKRMRAKKLKEMKANLEGLMRDYTETILESMVESKKVEEILTEKVRDLMKTFETLLEKIPRFIEADQRLIELRENELKMQAEELATTYKPLYFEIEDLLTEMNCLYLQSIRAYDIDISDLSGYEFLGEGQFARVYKAWWKPSKHEEPRLVAIKAVKDPVNTDNATDILQEEESLRRLQSPNVVKYYGTGVSHVEERTYPLYVMEYCTKTLAEEVYDPSYPAPGNCQSTKAANFEPSVRKAARYAWEVSSGLMAIHQFGYLHRDLKPENILVSAQGRVKIADLGLAKRAMDITGTLCGTPLYMAPEVLVESQYDEKADMFGFGMMLWELWYGECVIEVYQVENFREFIKNPFRVRFLKPSGEFLNLMQACWSEEPSARPTANECNRRISKAYLSTKK